MFRQLRTAVVIPAYNEARAIAATVETIPAFVDHVIVVDDASVDDTAARARAAGTRRARAGFECVRHPANRGVGAAIVTGYRRALALGADAIAVLAGDGQMDPSDLPALLEPIADDAADYVKGNRFMHPAVWSEMPAARIVGNVVLSAATRVTSGYRHVFDSQCGYTAIARRALEAMELEQVAPRYGYPNDLLSRLNVAGMRVTDVPVRPIYGPHWKSGISLRTALGPVPLVLLRSWAERLAAGARKRAQLA
jgi:glycosyltransferase involved in cell wall biosynthesis